ncbi:nSTAND1 domain-containing NTPase, partial [Streptomyces syringium]|uniref:nSTAND1 domain-containing NTPase n=1 Tax=Streptomyces syringium TaxID=76729 RepID=UPI00340E16B8
MDDAGNGLGGGLAGLARPGAPGAGELLRELRRRRGMSLAELARQAFYSKGYLSKVENGEKPLTLELARICDQVLHTEGALEQLVPSAARGRRRTGREEDACPYPGLSPYGAGDARWFFGRGEAIADLIAQLTERLKTPGPLLVMAPSGAGKSSLLRAGLLPALAHGVLPVPGARDWPVVLFTPGDHPLDELLARTAVATGADRRLLEKAQGEGGEALAAAVRAAVDGSRPGVHPDAEEGSTAGGPSAGQAAALIVVVDQFEETFMLCRDEEEQAAFVEALVALATRHGGEEDRVPPALVVLGARADFYDRCLAFPGLAASLRRGHVTLEPMGDAHLRAAITGPAGTAGLKVESGLVEILLRDIGLIPGRAARGGAARDGALPLLSHALLSTWQHRENATLTVDGYRLTGGICGAVTATAERVYASLSAQQQAVARHLLLRLVQVSEDRQTSRPGRHSDLLQAGPFQAGDAEAVIEAFTRARLLTVDADHVELAHEALLHAWPRLRQWIDDDRTSLCIRQTLTEAAARWENEGHDTSLLYRGTRLAAALEALTSPDEGAALPPAAQAFLSASTELETSEKLREQGRLRRLRVLTSGLAGLLVLSLIAGVIALQQSRAAKEQRRIAVSRELAARADVMLRDRPEAAMLLALGAYRRSPTAEARSSLLSTYAQYPGTQLTSHTDDAWGVAFSPDSRQVATVSDDHTAKIWDAASRRLIATLAGHTDRVAGVAFSPKGRMLATASRDGTAKLWDVGTHRLITTLTGHSGSVSNLAFSPDGRILATVNEDGAVRVWDVATHRQTARLADGTSSVAGIAFSPDGHTLAATYRDRQVRLWDLASRQESAVLKGHTESVMSVAFSPDGRTLATGSFDRTARLWDVESHRLIATLTGHSHTVMSVAFSPDGRTLATTSYDGTARLWETATHRAIGTLTGAGPLTAVAYSPDGRTLATTAMSGERGTPPALQLWDATALRKSGTLAGSEGNTAAVALSPDRHTLASGDSHGTILIWDTVTRGIVTRLTGHTDAITSLVFSPDGRTLASTSNDRSARLWDTKNYRETAVLTGHTRDLHAAAF